MKETPSNSVRVDAKTMDLIRRAADVKRWRIMSVIEIAVLKLFRDDPELKSLGKAADKRSK